MNFYGSAASGDQGNNVSLIHSDSHFADAIVVPDADLLIHGSYHRSGLDLVLTGHDGQHHVIPGYFASEHPQALAAPNGAYFSPDLVGLLAGSPAPHEYAQAQGQAAAPPDSIGKIQKIAGDVTVQRNGVSVALNVGDVVYKSDVIVTGADSKCGLTFPDGTALELLPNTRMALNEYDYDAKSTSNQALFTLVEGTFGFVAGKVAHTGDMKIGTPVATMGIRGTTGVVQMVKSSTGELTYSYSVYDDPGTTHSGSWDMFVDNPDGTQTLLATVSQTGYVTFVTSHGLHEPRFVSTVPLTASQVDADQLIIIDLADLEALNTRSIGIPGSGDNPLLQLPPNFLPDLFGNGGNGAFNYQLPPLPGPTPPQNPQNPNNPVASNVFIWPIGNSTWPTGGQWNQGFAPNAPIDIVIIESGVVTYSIPNPFTIYSLTIEGPLQNGGLPLGELNMITGELIVTNGLTVGGELFVGNGDPPRFLSYGPATILSGGQVIASGKGSTIEFMPDPSNPSATSVIVENFGAVRAEAGGIVKFIDTLVINEPAPAPTGDSESTPQPGIIEATGKGSLVKFKDSIVFNAGLVAAEHGGTVKFIDGSTVNNDPGSINTDTHAETAPGEIESIGRGSLVLFRHSSLDNFGVVAAEFGGRVEFLHAGTVTNAPETTALSGGDIESPTGKIESTGWGSDVSFVHTNLDNFGLVVADCYGAITFCDAKIVNEPSLITGATPAPAGLIEAEYGGFIGVDGGKVVNDKGASIDAKYGGVIDIGWAEVGNHKGALIEASHHGEISLFDADLDNKGTIKSEDCSCISIVGCDDGSVINVGLIEAKSFGEVKFDGLGSVVNDDGGEIEAKDHGTILFEDVAVTNFDKGSDSDSGGGLIAADGCGSTVELSNALISHGTVQSSDGGKIEAVYGDNEFRDVTIDGGIVQVDRHVSLALEGHTVIEKGTTFEGPGVFVLDHDDSITGDGSTVTLKNDSTIAGSGTIGGDGLKLVNESWGIVDADVAGKKLVIETGNTVVNEGLLKAARGGILDIKDDVHNNGGAIGAQLFGTVVVDGVTIDNTDHGANDGSVEADGCGATVVLYDGTDIIGGTLSTSDGGLIEIANKPGQTHSDVVFDGAETNVSGTILPLTIDGLVRVNENTALTLEGTIHNEGTIDVDGPPGADLIIEGTVKLNGSGFITLDGPNDEITGSGDDVNQLDNVNNTISGAGKIVGTEGKPLVLDNESKGVIDADVSGQVLRLETGNAVINEGLLEATSGGILMIEDDVDNKDGTIKARDPGSVVQLSAVTVTGGTFITGDPYWLDNGVIEILATSGMTVFDGSQTHDPVTIEGFVQVDQDAKLALKGTIDNEGGTVVVGPPDYYGADGAQLVIDGNVTLNGFGVVALEGNADGIVAGSDGGTLTNNSSIIGSRGGFIGTGDNELTFDNSGTVNSEAGDAGPLVINTGAKTVTNTGTLEATAGSELDLYGTYQNKGGTIGAFSESVGPSVVKLFNATIDGGTLQSDKNLHDGSMIEVVATNGTNESIFDGSHNNPLTVEAYVQVDAGANLELVGTIHDKGIIEVDGAVPVLGADLIIDGTVTLDGGGKVILAGAGDSIIGAAGDEASNTLVNSDTISGYGKIGNSGTDGSTDLTLNNADNGVVDANVSGQILAIDTDHTIINKGLMEATGGGTLEIENDVDNTGGMIKAAGTGSTLQFDAVTVTSGKIIIDAGDTLAIENGTTHLDADVENHGNLVIDSGSIIATLDVDAGSTIHGGTITIDGAGEFDVLGGGTFDSVTIDDKGIFDIDGPLTIAGDISIDLDGGTFTDAPTGILTVAEGTSATLSGVSVGTVDVEANATFTLDNADATEVDLTGSDATLALDTPSSFSGTVKDLAVGDTIDFANVGTVTGAVFDGSTLDVNGTSINISGLSASSYDFYFKPDGAKGTDFVVAAAPAVTITTPIAGDGIVNASEASAGFTLQGTASDTSVDVDGQTVTVDIFNSSDTLVDSFTTTVNAGAWTQDVPSSDTLPDGTYTVTANLTDWAVDPTSEATQAFTVDETAPTLAINAVNGNNIINAADAAGDETISGTASDAGTGVNNQTVTVEIVNSSNVVEDTLKGVVTNGAWSVDLNSADAQGLADGSYNVVASVSDVAGNQTTTTDSITVGETAPVITVPSGTQTVPLGTQTPLSVISVSEDNSAPGETFTVTLTDSTGLLSTSGGEGTITNNGSNDLIISGTLSQVNTDLGLLTDTNANGGADNITVSATDGFGNNAIPQTYDVTVSAPPPVITSADALGVVTENYSLLAPQNLINNGGFEQYTYNWQTNTYTIPDWTFGGHFYYPPGEASPPHSGYGDLAVYTYTLGVGTASQSFATDVGQDYDVTFYLYRAQGTTNSFSAIWDGTTEVSIVNQTTFGSYVEYQFDAVATQSTSTLQFDFYTGTVGYWFLDDVSVAPIITAGTENRAGTITFTDPTASNTHTVDVTPEANGYLGTFTANVTHDATGGGTGDVAWNFTVSDSALKSLAAGQIVTQTYDVAIEGSNGAQVEQPVTIELVGINTQAPTGFTFTPDVADLSFLQNSSSLESFTGVGTFTEAGGIIGDTFTFSLGGAGASAFSDSPGTTADGLYTGINGVTGSANGKVYALTLTITDADNAESSGPLPFDVVVGNSNANTINLETGINNLGLAPGTPTIVYGLSGSDAINATGMTGNVWFVGGAGADTMTGGSGQNTYLYSTVSDSQQGAGADTITNFQATDSINFSGLSGITGVQGLLTSTSTNIAAHSIAWVQSGGKTLVYANTSSTAHSQSGSSSSVVEIILNNFTATNLVGGNFVLSNGSVGPAGIAGAPINLALADHGAETSLTITGLPGAWSLNQGSRNSDGTWTVQTDDVTSVTVMTAAGFAGAALLNVTETWTNADGTIGTAIIADNVEAYAPGSPIFALAGDDTLTGAGGNDTFVFAQPIGNDVIYNFNAANDKIDLTGFAGIGSYGDLHIADDAGGDAVISLASGETITLHGVDASALSANDFVFDQTPVTVNHGTMTVSDGAALPLSGTIDNVGLIAIDSTGDQTVLQVTGDGMTLEGGGQVVMSGDATIVGTGPSDVLTNVDNTISGSGQIGDGDGNLTLINEAHGVINADVSGAALVLDTGHAIANAGLLEASNGGLLKVDDAVSGGSVDIAGGTVAFEAQSNVSVTFDNGQTGTDYGKLQLDQPAGFTGQIAGFTGTDAAHSDVVDLGGIDFNSAQFAETYHAATGVLSVTDGTDSASITFDNFQGALNFASDANGGTDITDAPATNAPATAEGTLSFVDNDAATDLSANVAPEGQNYVGNLTTGAVAESDGTASMDYGFSLGNDQIGVAAGQTVTQSYEVSLNDAQNPAANTTQTVAVTIGGAGNDNFVFAPGIGADTVLNFNPQQDTVELDHFTNAQTVQQLQALITTDTHGDAVIDLGNHDSITFANTTSAQLQQAIQNGHVLLH